MANDPRKRRKSDSIIIEQKDMTLLPCAPDVCQECAVKHESWQAHNNQSLYYQFKFYREHGRSPTWADAISHCPKDIQEQWKIELTKLGKWTEPVKNNNNNL